MEDMHLIWEKMSDRILNHINGRFDKLDQILEALRGSHKELLEKIKAVEEQTLDHESRISSLEKTVSGLKDEKSHSS